MTPFPTARGLRPRPRSGVAALAVVLAAGLAALSAAPPAASALSPDRSVAASLPAGGGPQASDPEAGGRGASDPEAGGREAGGPATAPAVAEAGGRGAGGPEAGGRGAGDPEAGGREAGGPATAPAVAEAGAGVGPVTVDQAATGSVFLPITPQRVLDTRLGQGGSYLQPGAVQTLTVTTPAVLAAAGLGSAANVRGVVLNVTATQAAGPGFVTLWPAGSPWPGSSNLNLERPGHTVPNLVTTSVSAGRVHLLASTGTHAIADVQGLYVESPPLAGAGRLVPVGPIRAYDSRQGAWPLAPGEERVVDLSGTGVPVGASAAVLTVTAVAAPNAGYWTVWPADRARPLASNLNPEGPGHTVANQVITGIDGARVRLMGIAGGHVVIDVAGYVTGSGATASAEGLFVPMTPARLADTRQPGLPGSRPDGSRLPAGSTIDIPVAGRGGLPSMGVAAVALNVTVTQAGGPGFVTVWAAGTPRPLASIINPERAGQTVAGHAVSPVGNGAVSLFTLDQAHLIADVTGYWTGPAGVPGSPPDPPVTVVDVKPGPQPPVSPTQGPHSFLYVLADGSYARWNPCAAIRYAVNDDRAVSGQRAMLENAVLDAEAATGLDLVYVGETSAGLDGRPPAGADVVLAFTDAAASPQLGTAVGLGGGGYRASGVVSGYALFVNVYGTGSHQQDLMLHEIGHMLGINHVNDPSQVMNPYVVPLPTYSNGDREGLWRMGAAQGCTSAGQAQATSTVGTPDPLLEAWGYDDHPAPAGQ